MTLIKNILLFALMILFIFSCQRKEQIKKQKPKQVIKHEIKYGVIVDSLVVKYGKIKDGEFLSNILLKYNISYPLIDALVKKAKPVFDFRKIRPGNKYAVIQDKESPANTLYFVYEINKIDYTVVDLTDSMRP